MEEIWNDVLGNDAYQASDQGNVKSLNYNHTGKEQLLKPGKNTSGYLQVVLCKDGVPKPRLVSLLVWEAFNGPIPEGYEVNHINENKEDNRLENLNLMTRKENVNWGTGIRRAAKAQRKMIEQYTLDGTHICTWFGLRTVKEEGFNPGKVCMCCQGKRSKHKGFIWKYAYENCST